MQPVFFVARDGDVYRWSQRRPGLLTTSRESFPTLPIALAAAAMVARCYCGLFRCPNCGTEYNPTWGRACPSCGAGGKDYSDVLPAEQREDYIGE